MAAALLTGVRDELEGSVAIRGVNIHVADANVVQPGGAVRVVVKAIDLLASSHPGELQENHSRVRVRFQAHRRQGSRWRGTRSTLPWRLVRTAIRSSAFSAPLRSAMIRGKVTARTMDLHSNLNERVVLGTTILPWAPSPMIGVERRMLERSGGEVARATSIVRYAPGSHFERHPHTGGEEILVLEGTFSDEQGDYPAGTYVRNPAGSAHSPFSEEGCTILVKLQQMHPADLRRIVIDTHRAAWMPGLVPGLHVMPLHSFGSEQVALVRWDAGTLFRPHRHFAGEEILVLQGVFQDEQGDYPAGSWLRNPPGSVHQPWSEPGCTIWVKTGHLPTSLGPDGSTSSLA